MRERAVVAVDPGVCGGVWFVRVPVCVSVAHTVAVLVLVVVVLVGGLVSVDVAAPSAPRSRGGTAPAAGVTKVAAMTTSRSKWTARDSRLLAAARANMASTVEWRLLGELEVGWGVAEKKDMWEDEGCQVAVGESFYSNCGCLMI